MIPTYGDGAEEETRRAQQRWSRSSWWEAFQGSMEHPGQVKYHHCNVIANTHMVVYDETMTMKINKQRWWWSPGWQPVRQASIPSSAPLRRWQGKSKPQSRRNASEQCWGWNPPRLAQLRTCNWQLNNWEPGQVSLSTCLGRWAERALGTFYSVHVFFLGGWGVECVFLGFVREYLSERRVYLSGKMSDRGSSFSRMATRDSFVSEIEKQPRHRHSSFLT